MTEEEKKAAAIEAAKVKEAKEKESALKKVAASKKVAPVDSVLTVLCAIVLDDPRVSSSSKQRLLKSIKKANF